jgi:GNAT superfamily N-acetyltransferase
MVRRAAITYRRAMATSTSGPHTARLATPDDAPVLAELLHAFNTEFDTPSPGPPTLEPRLRVLLDGDDAGTFAVLGGDPPVALALVTLRTNVWYDGRVAILDEMYVAPDRRSAGIGSQVIELVLRTCRDRGVALLEINVDEDDVDAMRFYERHGFAGNDPDTGDRAFYFQQELG